MSSRSTNDEGGFLLVFLRYPEPGRVKTRLAGEIGAERAAAVYERLLRRTLGIVSDIKREHPRLRALLFYTPGDPVDKLEERFSGPWTFFPQEGEHLGDRMENALKKAFSMGAKKAVLIGSDIVDIRAEEITLAFRLTGSGTAALGPANDGGFYLIGLAGPCGAPFGFTDWGTGSVFERTERALAGAGLRVASVARRSDLDRPADMLLADSDPLLGKSLSVIIPTLYRPEKLAPLIDFMKKRLWPGDEIIVAQGLASGDTGAKRSRDKLVLAHCPRGRGIQQSFGAFLARGDLLFFLHDDTIPPPDFPYLIRKACVSTDVSLGCFRLAFCQTVAPVALIADWANIRTAVFKLPYGDQGLFCRKEVFDGVGGFHHRYLFEDVDLVRRCRKRGRLLMLPDAVHTSPDRYIRKGPLIASIQNHFLTLLHLLGVSESELYSMYYR